MKCLILAAGYATRLYPLTKDFPKPLLKVKGKAILDWLIDDIDGSKDIDEYILISNHKFYDHFLSWSKGRKEKIMVLDDGTKTNEGRLGALRDIEYAVREANIHDDVLIIAGDNLLDFSLGKFIDYAKKKGASAIMRYLEPDKKKLLSCATLIVDGDDLVAMMEEKSPSPKSSWCAPPFYYCRQEDLLRINEAILDGVNVDAPGSFAAWLSSKSKVYAMKMPGCRYDIGDIASYEEVEGIYKGVK